MEKGLLDPIEIIIGPPFTKDVMEYPNGGKLKLPLIDPYDRTKDHIDYIQTFQFHMHYVGAPNTIMC